MHEAAKIFRTQDGVIARKQVDSKSYVDTKLRRGAWVSVAAGVYRPTELPLGPRGTLRAATLIHPTAVVSHLSAAWLWNLTDQPPGQPHLTHKTTGDEGFARLFRSTLEALDVQNHAGFRVTRPTRTILDCAGLLLPNELENLFDKAALAGLVSAENVFRRLQTRQHTTRRGTASLRRIVIDRIEHGRIESPLEARVIRIFREAGLPEPRRQVQIRQYRVDVLFEEQRLVVEIDGMAAHSGSRRYTRDVRRTADLESWGYDVLRITSEMINDSLCEVVMRTGMALGLFPTRWLKRA